MNFSPPQRTPQGVVGEISVKYLQVFNAYRYFLALTRSVKVGPLVMFAGKHGDDGFRAGKTTYLWHELLLRYKLFESLICQVKI